MYYDLVSCLDELEQLALNEGVKDVTRSRRRSRNSRRGKKTTQEQNKKMNEIER